MNVESVSASTPVLELTSDTLTLGTYRQTLTRFHGLYRTLEVGVQAVGGWTDRGVDLARRWKPPRLESDLRALGEDDPAALPVCTDLPPHATVGAAFGCLDVLEGATLGGQVISGVLEKSPGSRRKRAADSSTGTATARGKWGGCSGRRSLLSRHSLRSGRNRLGCERHFFKLHPWIETGASHQ